MSGGVILAPSLSGAAGALVLAGAKRGPERALALYSESRRSPNYWRNPARRRVRMIVWHISQGSAESSLSWLCNPESQASSTDLIDRLGTVYNLVRGDDAPWTNGPVCRPNVKNPILRAIDAEGLNPNWYSYTIECAGYSSEFRGGSLTPGQIASLILRTAQACYYYRLTADRVHIVGHDAIDDCDRHYCPGFSLSEWTDWTEAVYQVCRSWRGW